MRVVRNEAAEDEAIAAVEQLFDEKERDKYFGIYEKYHLPMRIRLAQEPFVESFIGLFERLEPAQLITILAAASRELRERFGLLV